MQILQNQIDFENRLKQIKHRFSLRSSIDYFVDTDVLDPDVQYLIDIIDELRNDLSKFRNDSDIYQIAYSNGYNAGLNKALAPRG